MPRLPRTPLAWPLFVFAVVLVLLATSCFEPAVTETIEIRALTGGRFVVTASLTIARDATNKNDRQTQALIEELTHATLHGDDFWSRRFERVHSPAEQFSWDKEQGNLVRASHSLTLENPEDLRRVFEGAVAALHHRAGPPWAELAVSPLPGIRSSGAQRKALEAAMGDWCALVSRYLARCRALYAYLKDHPERAEGCLGSLFGDLDDDVKRTYGEPREEEKTLLEPLLGETGSLNEMLGLLATPRAEASSLNELSRAVYAPFPSALSVRVPGAILESEGFEVRADGLLAVPDISLYGALRSLEGQWIAPDPFLAMVESMRQTDPAPFDLQAFAGRERVIGPAPTASEVRSAVEHALAPAPAYRVRWSETGVQAAPDPDHP